MVLDFLPSTQYFGNTLEQIVFFLATVILGFLAGKIAYFLIRNYLSKLAQKTSSKLDDILLAAIEKPLLLFVFLIGFSFGLRALSIDAGLQSVLQNLVNAGLTIGVAWFLIKLIDGLIRELVIPMAKSSSSKLDDQLIPILSKGLKITVAVIAIIVIADTYFGVDVTAPLVGLGIGGIALAFAAQQTLSDVFGGISIFAGKPFVIGDFISFEGIYGTVEEVGLRHTRIRTLEQQYLTVPNAKLSGAVVTNHTLTTKRRISFNLGLVYKTPAKKISLAKELLSDILSKIPLVEKEPKPVIVFNEFKDSSLNILVTYFVLNPDWLVAQTIRDQVNLEIKSRFEKARIEFAYPTQTVFLEK